MVPATSPKLNGRLNSGTPVAFALVVDRGDPHGQTRLGAFAVVLDPKDSDARKFYETLGFMPMIGETQRLFVPIATALAAARKP
jgi:hypothetical protein